VPIPLEEALDSFDESPEIEQEAVNFQVGEKLLELKDGEEGRRDPPQVKQLPSKVSVKASSEPPPDGHAKPRVLATSRPLLKMTVSNPLTDEQEKDNPNLTRSVCNVRAMSHGHLRPEEDVTIIVEDEC
jgi:hypothetical protein